MVPPKNLRSPLPANSGRTLSLTQMSPPRPPIVQFYNVEITLHCSTSCLTRNKSPWIPPPSTRIKHSQLTKLILRQKCTVLHYENSPSQQHIFLTFKITNFVTHNITLTPNHYALTKVNQSYIDVTSKTSKCPILQCGNSPSLQHIKFDSRNKSPWTPLPPPPTRINHSQLTIQIVSDRNAQFYIMKIALHNSTSF